MTAMPMFPLGTVVLPGGLLPLHVFEPRYRQLVIDCLAEDGPPEFGQVLITHGAETGGGDERSSVGTVIRALQIEALDAHRYALVGVGTRRVRIDAWLPDDPYPRASVADWPDADDWPPAVDVAGTLRHSHQRVRTIRALAAELGDVPIDDVALTDDEIIDDPVLATYHLATIAPLGAADRYRLLSAAGPAARVAILDGCLDDVEAALRFRLS